MVTGRLADAALIRLAAERVMGWAVHGSSGPHYWHFTDPPQLNSAVYLCGHCNCLPNWNPLASDSDAMMMVDKIEGEFTLERSYMLQFNGYAWYADFDGEGKTQARDVSRQRAIVLAALNAVGVEGRARPSAATTDAATGTEDDRISAAMVGAIRKYLGMEDK